VPGIVADRFVFFSSISFSLALVWGLFLLFKVKPNQGFILFEKRMGIVLVVLLILIPYGFYVHQRNKQWKTLTSLLEGDMDRLHNSVKANNLLASEIISRVNTELAKPVNPYKFVVKRIEKAEQYYKRAVELDSTHVASINGLGVIYSRIHGNQALIRERGYKKQDRLEEAKQAHRESVEYFNKAIGYFHDALKYDPQDGSSYYNLGNIYEMMQVYDSARAYYQKEINVDGPTVVSMSRLSNVLYKLGDVEAAVNENREIINMFPDSFQPYINLGNYAFMANDTVTMLSSFTKAVKLGAGPEVSKFLSSYYSSIGDTRSANYYQMIADKAGNNPGKK
jgi:tetratricopeptide (TPR) repeat protein